VAGCRHASKATTGSTPRPAHMDGDGGSGSVRVSDACGDGNLLVTHLARWDVISLSLSLYFLFPRTKQWISYPSPFISLTHPL
jgi:hypothetical protein